MDSENQNMPTINCYLPVKKNGIMIFANKLMDLEKYIEAGNPHPETNSNCCFSSVFPNFRTLDTG